MDKGAPFSTRPQFGRLRGQRQAPNDEVNFRGTTKPLLVSLDSACPLRNDEQGRAECNERDEVTTPKAVR